MAKYLIHSCNKRKWYVDQFLVPSMIKQGINQDDILVYNDNTKAGCLPSFIESAKMILDEPGGVWHLQDDVIISSWFKRITEEFDRGIVCGFCSYYSKDVQSGCRPINDLWYSFPCIRIPNSILKGFIEWLSSASVQNKYQAYIKERKFVDTLFRIYVLDEHHKEIVRNLNPNIVDNVDYLLGGSTINYARAEKPVSLYFQESELIEKLKMELSKR